MTKENILDQDAYLMYSKAKAMKSYLEDDDHDFGDENVEVVMLYNELFNCIEKVFCNTLNRNKEDK